MCSDYHYSYACCIERKFVAKPLANSRFVPRLLLLRLLFFFFFFGGGDGEEWGQGAAELKYCRRVLQCVLDLNGRNAF